jgi:hypothetical protein
MRFVVSDDTGVLRRFEWEDEALRFIDGRSDLKLTKLPKPEKEDNYAKAMRLLGEALI